MRTDGAEASAPRFDARRAVVIGVVLSLAIFAFSLTFDSVDSLLPLKPKPGSGIHPVPRPLAFGACVLLGMGLGSILSLYWSNRHRMRAVCAFRWARAAAATVFALLVPFTQFWAIPMAFGFLVPRVLSVALQGGSVEPGLPWIPVVFFLVVLPLAYVVTGLIISGTRSRLVRIALFGQVWLACYGATLLIFGFYQGNM